MMKKAVAILLFSITSIFAFSQNKRQYQYYNNIPTKNGIQHYIDLNMNNIVSAVENFIGDTIASYSIKVDNLSEYANCDSLEAGRFYPEDQIIITNEPKFYDYELLFVNKWNQRRFNNNTNFVKGVIIHELTHLYIYQFIYDCLKDNIPINTEYINFNMIPNRKSYYASEFIEEGICEYVVMKLREGIFSEYRLNCPGSNIAAEIKKFNQQQNTYTIRYQYSRTYVQKLFENTSFRKALLNILTNKPPSYEELMCPDLYYKRLMTQSKD